MPNDVVASEVVPIQYLVLLLRFVSFSRIRIARIQDQDRTAPESLKFVQNLVLNVGAREGEGKGETKDFIRCTSRKDAMDTNYLTRSIGKRRSVYSKAQLNYLLCILDVYICVTYKRNCCARDPCKRKTYEGKFKKKKRKH